MPDAVCPICGQVFDVQLTSAMPFCSERCQRLDLGRWLDERYGLPVQGGEGEGDDHSDEEA